MGETKPHKLRRLRNPTMGLLRAGSAGPAVLALTVLGVLDFHGADAFLSGAGLYGPVYGGNPARGVLQAAVRRIAPVAGAPRARPQLSVLRMDSDKRNSGENHGSDAAANDSKGKKVAIRKGDVEVFLDMARAEEKQGNSTGAAAYRGIAERMDNIMSRSTARMSNSLDLRESAGGEEGAGGESKNVWKYLDQTLTADGRNVWRTTEGEHPASARLLDSFQGGAGASITWSLRVNELNGPVCIGLTTLDVDLNKPWNEIGSLNSAFYLTQNGNLYNGDQLVFSPRPTAPRAGAAAAPARTHLTPLAPARVAAPPPPPSRTKWTRLVHPSVLTGHVTAATT